MAPTNIYTLSLHDALPIYPSADQEIHREDDMTNYANDVLVETDWLAQHAKDPNVRIRSEEHTSELQSRQYLVCRLLLEKKKIHDETHLSNQNPSKTL